MTAARRFRPPTLNPVRVLVAGAINIETTVPVAGFPVPYAPVAFNTGIASAVSGVGWNLARALSALGSEVVFLSVAGPDPAGTAVREEVARSGITAVIAATAATPLSVILYDPAGRRRAETDLKGVQETAFPGAAFDEALAGCDLAVLANSNWTRPLLSRAAAAGVPVATDLHDIRSLDNPYDADYLAHAAVLFFSGELLPVPPEEFVARVWDRADPRVVGVGLGSRGALLALPGSPASAHPGAVAAAGGQHHRGRRRPLRRLPPLPRTPGRPRGGHGARRRLRRLEGRRGLGVGRVPERGRGGGPLPLARPAEEQGGHHLVGLTRSQLDGGSGPRRMGARPARGRQRPGRGTAPQRPGAYPSPASSGETSRSSASPAASRGSSTPRSVTTAVIRLRSVAS